MSVKIVFDFDTEDEDAIAAALEQAGAMITGITDETEAAIRSMIGEAIREGVPPYDAARAISSMIGLTSAQGQAALKYRKQLIDNGLTLTKVNEKVDEYADELLGERANTIARTEIMDALNAGQDEAWLQAQADGYLSPDATKEWITTPDDALCDECEAMDGHTVAIGDDFAEGDPPLHPNCRCTTGIAEP